jgi:hypothetical protein
VDGPLVASVFEEQLSRKVSEESARAVVRMNMGLGMAVVC